MSSPQNNDTPAGSYNPADRYNNSGYYPPVTTYTPSIYNPMANYNQQLPADFAAALGGNTGAVSVSPFLPSQTIGNPNIWRIASILDGTTDPTYTHVVTSAEFTAKNWVMKFPHNLSFTPSVTGSFYMGLYNTNAPTNIRYPLPWVYLADGTNYNGIPQSATVTNTRLDDKYIYINAAIHDGLGASFFLTYQTMYFKLYCFQDGTVSQ